MKQTIIQGDAMPTANITIGKSRLKVYNKETDPTYYLNSGQEFGIELFNPTTEMVLAKIYLNGKAISQGGLVLKPAQRVFLDRYIDVAKKFLFETYEVVNTKECIAAIEQNGDFKVEFYKEQQVLPYFNTQPYWGGYNTLYYVNQNPTYYPSILSTQSTDTYSTAIGTNGIQGIVNCTSTLSTQGSNLSTETEFTNNRNLGKKKLKKSIETGRVEKGSDSKQELQTADYNFNTYSFHKIEYKLLPTSQKINTVEEITIKKYCVNCGTKCKSEHRFCSSCGAKQ